jgi:hypothetical protein
MTYILTCGCESQYGGFPSEWDSESRECEPTLSYGSLCEKHFDEYEARPAQYTATRELMPTIVKDEQGKVVAVTLTNEEHQVQEVLWQAPRELSDDEIKTLHDETSWWGVTDPVKFAKAILKKASYK